MRGAGRIGGRAFRPPKPQDGGKGYNPFDLLDIGDLPVAPILTPINDNFSWSIDAEPADPRDCSRYPASPYCGGLPLDPKPFGVRTEIRSNGCETCVYVYPVVMWLMATPQVICYRDPNCDKEDLPPPISEIPEDLNENVPPDPYTSPECAAQLSAMHRYINQINRRGRKREKIYQNTVRKAASGVLGEARRQTEKESVNLGIITTTAIIRFNYGGVEYGAYSWDGVEETYEPNRMVSVGIIAGLGFSYVSFKRGGNICPPPPTIKPPPPPPDDDDDRKRRERGKKRGKKMCCNQCSDAADNTAVLLREIKALKKALGTGQFEKAVDAAVGIGDGSVTAIVNTIAKRIGTSRYPIEVPLSLLTLYKDNDKSQKLESQADYMYWLTLQLDALIGEFPIDIEIKDIDPLTAGDQKKTIQLTNIAETLAEIYGLSIKGSVNQEAEQAILLRLAIEAIAIKNGVAITQDYVKANTKFLGYRGNPVDRKLNYSFDFSSIDLAKKEQTVLLDAILKPTEAYVRGWENKDKETAADFFQKLMFSAGIIKAVFFRDKKQMKDVLTKADEMVKEGLKKEDEWKDFVQGINNPNSSYNKGKNEQPEIKIETRDPNKPI